MDYPAERASVIVMGGQLSHCGKCCAYTESDFNDNCVKCGNTKGERLQAIVPDPVSLEFDGGVYFRIPDERVK